jgi:hypothetical protein
MRLMRKSCTAAQDANAFSDASSTAFDEPLCLAREYEQVLPAIWPIAARLHGELYRRAA